MTFLAFLFILISLVTFVAAQLILKKAMEFSATTRYAQLLFHVARRHRRRF